MLQISEAEIYRACRTLFGPELQLNREFLHYLQPSGARTAYRKKAKLTHPDRFAVSASHIQEKQHRLFQDLNQAHDTIQSFLKHKKMLPATKCFRSKPNNYHQKTQQQTRPQPPHQRRRQDPPPHSKYYRGTLPPRPLQFGLFLYYLGIIPFSAVISAITWQRRQRPILGDIARRWGWLDESQVNQVLAYRNGGSKFGERAEQLGLLSSLQVRAMLLHQRSRQQQMGQFFIEQGYLDTTTLNQLLEQLAEHNQKHRSSLNSQFYYYHRK